jgi:hypothetical protein
MECTVKPSPGPRPPPGASKVCPIWNYSQKVLGEHKAWKCMDHKQLIRMGAKISNTYAACMEHHCLHLFIAFTAYLENIIDDRDVVNAYAHAPAEGPPIYIIIDDIFQALYNERFDILLRLGTRVRVFKAM